MTMMKWKTLPFALVVAAGLLVASRPAHAVCGEWECASNSPQIDDYDFHELNVNGVPSPVEGFALVWFHDLANQPYRLTVVNGTIIGKAKGKSDLVGGKLVGAQMLVSHRGIPRYLITITEVGGATFATAPSDKIETYRFTWTRYGSPPDPVDLCTHPPTDPTLVGDSETGDWGPFAAGSGMNLLHTLVFEGDRIDAAAKTITGYDRDWFNFGCAGHTLSKMHLTHNTGISGLDKPSATQDRRQTVLKMLVADYCGDGTPFTVTGESLVWTDRTTMSFYKPPQSLEARWGPRGPTCLDTPRVTADPTNYDLAKSEFPDVEAAIAAQCTRPIHCPDPDPTVDEGELVRTGNHD